MNKIYALEGLRGLAVLLVFWEHSKFPVNPHLGQAAVYTFFILSAFLMFLPFFDDLDKKYNTKDYIKYYIRRFFRIYPIYFFITTFLVLNRIFVIGVGYMTPKLAMSQYFFLQDVTPTFNFRLLPVTWTLVIEVQFYVFIPLIAYLLLKNKKNIYYKIAALFIIGWLTRNVFAAVFDVAYGKPWFFMYLDLFAIGILLSYLYKQNKLFKYKVNNILLFIIVVIWCYLALHTNFGKYGQDMLMLVIMPLFAVSSFFIFTQLLVGSNNNIINRIFLSKILMFLGSIGYSFYLLHDVILDPAITPYFAYSGDSTLVFFFVIIAKLLFVIGVSYLLYILIEKPFIKIGKKICSRI